MFLDMVWVVLVWFVGVLFQRTHMPVCRNLAGKQMGQNYDGF